ncbi:MAG: heme exporter protein CcmD [Devosia sp.]
MIELGPHAVFIESAYAGVLVVTLAVITWVTWQSMQTKAKLASLEAQGIRRRSAGQGS